MTFTLSMNVADLDALVDGIEADVVAAARPAAQAAAQVLYQQVQQNVAALGRKTGNLSRAIYQVYSQSQSSEGHAVYHISWNARKAPHGGLVEFGHVQRYATYVGKDGKWYTAVRAEMRGKRRPSRRAPQGVKDAYYVTLPAPKQVAAKAFIRSAASRLPVAQAAATEEFMRRIS